MCLPSRSDFHMVKSTSSDAPLPLGTPVSASEVAAALLGASTSSLCGFRRHRKIEEEDISTPYNHYKCLSPKQRVGKLLRRQFSLDRTEEYSKHEETTVSEWINWATGINLSQFIFDSRIQTHSILN